MRTLSEIELRQQWNRSVGKSPQYRMLYLSQGGRREIERQMEANERAITILRELFQSMTAEDWVVYQ